MNRRHFLYGGCAVAALSATGPARADEGPNDTTIISAVPPLPPDLTAQADQPPAPYTTNTLVGTAPPSRDEIDRAYEILVNSPYGIEPIDIAQYFLAVGAGAYGAENQPFAREWPVRANPLIFHLFSATQTKPEGDVTAWCAAFVNWCIARAHASSSDEIGTAPGAFSQSGKPFSVETLKMHTTNNASSGSFRCWDATPSPKRGDLAVFRDIGTDSLTSVCRGSGHVTFVLRPSETSVRVLGGNQSARGCNGAVTVADMKTAPGGRFFKYVGLR